MSWYEDHVQEQIDLEHQAWRDINALLSEAVRIADENYVWHEGNGYGGAMLDLLLKLAQDRGLPISETENAPAPSKRKPISYSTRYGVMERDGFKCQQCGVQKRLVIDHIHPVSKGGTNDLDNLQTLCHDCNTEKGAKV